MFRTVWCGILRSHSMTILIPYFLDYALPALATGTLIKFVPTKNILSDRRYGGVLVHVVLLGSIFASQYSLHALGIPFPWTSTLPSLVFFALCVLFAALLLRWLGVWYSLSAFVQQLSMFSVAVILLPSLSLLVVTPLIIIPFVYAHPFQKSRGLLRVTLFSAWGIISVLLYAFLPNLWVIAGLHTLVGALAIRFGILFPSKESGWQWNNGYSVWNR